MQRYRRILVTGAAGMIGSHLARRLLADGVQVTAMVRPGGSRIRLQGLENRMEIRNVDMTDEAAVRKTVAQARPEVVFHLASTLWAGPRAADATTHAKVNVLGSVYLLEAIREFTGSKIIFTGTAATYGSGSLLDEERRMTPNTIYGASKAAASIFIQTYGRLYGMSTVALRLFMPYGPWEHPDRLIPSVILAALEGRDIPMTLGTQQRDLVYVDDVVEALVLAAVKPVSPGTVLNIGSGTGRPVREVVEQLLALMGNPVKPLIGVVPMRPDEIMEMSADITLARTSLGWEPRTPLAEGLSKTIAWVSEYRDLLSTLRARSPQTALAAAR